jgi:hypothetical protein
LDAALPEALPTTVTASEASANASTGLVSTGVSDNLSLAAELLHDSHSATLDPIIAGTADFSAFDPHAFTNILNPAALDIAGGCNAQLV